MPTATTHCRWMIAKDLPAVLGVERETFGDWDEEFFREVLRNRNRVMFVAEAGDVVVGFFVIELCPEVMRVLNMASLTPDARRVMLDKLAYKAESHRRELVWE